MKIRFHLVLPFISLVGLTACGEAKKPASSISYDESWVSIKKLQTPVWIQDDKFGIFIHWGPYAVPAYGSEW